MDVTESRSWQHLEELARTPFDLAAFGALEKNERIVSMVCRAAGLKLIYATQRVDEAVLDGFQALVDEHQLVERFLEMKRGAVLNRIVNWESENRQVLHTSSRDIFSDKPAEPVSAQKARQEINKLKLFLNQIDAGEVTGSTGRPFKAMINIGIGGSDLGPRSIYEALKAYRLPGRTVHFIANVDPDDAADVLRSVDREQTIVNVVSKSGTTLETLTNETIVRESFKDRGLDPRHHFIAVTGAGSPMDSPEHYLQSFHMFDYIGGRYSTTSMVGCAMLGFALGYECLSHFLQGGSCNGPCCRSAAGSRKHAAAAGNAWDLEP